jgi:hypothetical protein
VVVFYDVVNVPPLVRIRALDSIVRVYCHVTCTVRPLEGHIHCIIYVNLTVIFLAEGETLMIATLAIGMTIFTVKDIVRVFTAITGIAHWTVIILEVTLVV